MSEADVPLAHVRVELEKLGFRDLPEHLLVSFMQSIMSEEVAATATSGACLNVPSGLIESRDTNCLRSNGAISTQSASATFASAALKTRVSGRKVTILSPSKGLHPASCQTEMQEDQRPLPPQRLQQQDLNHQEQQRRLTTSNLQELRTPSEHAFQCSSGSGHTHGVHIDANGSKSWRGMQQTRGQEPHVVHSVPSAHMSHVDPVAPAASIDSDVISDENSVPASQRLDAANNALRAAISCKSSSLRAHSSSSSVIFASVAPSRPRSRHDPVKAFQNHVSLVACIFNNVHRSSSHIFPLSSHPVHRRLNGRPLLIRGYRMRGRA